MAIEAVVQFLEATAQDEALRKGLAGIIGTGDGDISSAQALDQEEAGALLGQRSLLVTTFAEQNGYAFTVAELKAVIGVFQRYKAGELSEVEFSSALGLDSSSKLAASQLDSLGKTVGMVFLGVKYNVKKDTRSAHQVLDFMKKTAQDAEFRKEHYTSSTLLSQHVKTEPNLTILRWDQIHGCIFHHNHGYLLIQS